MVRYAFKHGLILHIWEGLDSLFITKDSIQFRKDPSRSCLLFYVKLIIKISFLANKTHPWIQQNHQTAHNCTLYHLQTSHNCTLYHHTIRHQGRKKQFTAWKTETLHNQRKTETIYSMEFNIPSVSLLLPFSLPLPVTVPTNWTQLLGPSMKRETQFE